MVFDRFQPVNIKNIDGHDAGGHKKALSCFKEKQKRALSRVLIYQIYFYIKTIKSKSSTFLQSVEDF